MAEGLAEGIRFRVWVLGLVALERILSMNNDDGESPSGSLYVVAGRAWGLDVGMTA